MEMFVDFDVCRSSSFHEIEKKWKDWCLISSDFYFRLLWLEVELLLAKWWIESTSELSPPKNNVPQILCWVDKILLTVYLRKSGSRFSVACTILFQNWFSTFLDHTFKSFYWDYFYSDKNVPECGFLTIKTMIFAFKK